MKKFLAALVVLFPAILPAQNSGMESFSLDVKEFDELKVVDGINVTYFCDPQQAGTVKFESTQALADAIIFDSNGKGKLEVKLAIRDKKYENLPTVRVYSSYLTKIENDGDSTVTVAKFAPGPKFQGRLIGNGRLVVNGITSARTEFTQTAGNGQIVANGKTESANLKIAGVGRIEAYDLDAKEVSAKVLGTGWIQCSASERLNVVGAGTGTVTYKGRPVVKDRALNIKTRPFDH
ncbi:MAG: DUF2807 domain-containing protein [Muribaculaceae bacterium]|nr:DUF2807 domain-containing protein [Muribaculaceae bacterium]